MLNLRNIMILKKQMFASYASSSARKTSTNAATYKTSKVREHSHSLYVVSNILHQIVKSTGRLQNKEFKQPFVQQQQQFFIDQVNINSMQTVKIINTTTWQGDSKNTKESPRQLPPHKHLIQHTYANEHSQYHKYKN